MDIYITGLMAMAALYILAYGIVKIVEKSDE
jgi:hypothetical protein